MFDQTFWVALAFVMFIAVVYKPVSRKMAAALDARAEKIKQELDEAVRLREEAQALLAGYERRQNEALKEAEDILGHAREEAERQTRQAGEALEVFIRRREAQARSAAAEVEEEQQSPSAEAIGEEKETSPPKSKPKGAQDKGEHQEPASKERSKKAESAAS